jgi:hypothetical protein
MSQYNQTGLNHEFRYSSRMSDRLIR